MRGTILRLKSHSFDLSPEDADFGEESKPFEIAESRKSPSDFQNLSGVENPSEDANKKNMLMSNLELQSSSSSMTQTGLSNHGKTSLHRPVFDWNDEHMWKAMSKHPLFSKYMELQSQLNNLFEEIRLDCKRAACERAFATLIKETSDSPILATSVTLPPPVPTEIPAKKKGRPLKRKPGRPRKIALSNMPADCNNETAGTPKRVTRKCRDELFLSRSPSWICQNCAKRFSSAGWLDRHKSVCSFSKLRSHDHDNAPMDENLDVSKPPSQNANPGEDIFVLGEGGVRLVSPGAPLPNLRAMYAVNGDETPENSLTSYVSPLQPKMENQNCPEDDEVSKRQLCNEEPHCSEGEDSIITCGKCKNKFANQAHLKSHWEEFSECKVYALHHGSDGECGEYSSDSSSSACKHCGKSFRKNKFLKRHQSMCHVKSKEKLWQCVYCFKSFSRPRRHETHQKKCYAKQKPVGRHAQRCENCSSLFPTQKRLLKHQAVCCPDSFVTSDNHMVKFLKCLKCPLVFPTYKKQLKHRAICCPDSDTEAMVCHCSKVLIMPDRMAAHKKKCQNAAKHFQELHVSG